ncbi:MAG: hypothetical protein JO128_10925 [Alphaproteobacteria bacterium]|nr:hypothetical protein [Alphaproteobacteria bacterium]
MRVRRTRHYQAGIAAVWLSILAGGLCGSAWGQTTPAPVSVPVRFGGHPTYERLVFDWPTEIPYRVDDQGSTASITFDQPATFDAAQIKRDLAKVAPGVSVSASGNSTTLTFQLDSGVHLRHFRSGAKVVLDFSRTETAPPPPSAAAAHSAASGPTAARSPSPWEQLPLASGAAAQPEREAAASGPAASVTPASTAPAAPTPASGAPARTPAASAPTLPSETEALAQVREQAKQLATAPPVRLSPAPSPTAPRPPQAAAAPQPAAGAPGAPAAPAAPAAGAPPTPAASADRSQAFREAQARRQEVKLAAAERRDLGAPVPVVRSEGQGLRFKWPDPVTAAAFTRGPYVFLLFNKRALLDLSSVKTPPPDDLVGQITPVDSEGTAVRLLPPPNTYFAMRAEDNSWVVEMTRRPRLPDAPADVTTVNEDDPAQARVRVALRGGEAVVSLHDPEIGDDLKVVPTAVPGAGIEDEHDFPQFAILGSAQGLVIKSQSDGLIVRPVGPYVEIYSPGGTLLSPPDEVPADQRRDAADSAQPQIFHFADWRRDDGRPYLARLRELEQAAAAVPRGQRNPPRLALARFLFASGDAVEADGVLANMAQDQPALANTELYHALKGATALMAGNLDEAALHLRNATLDRTPEIAMWRVALDMAQGDQTAAIEQMSKGPDMTRSYPAPYANRLGLAIAEALIDLGDIPAARDRLDAIAANSPDPSEEGQERYLRGRLALLEGKPDEAREIWSSLEHGDPSPARILATLAEVDNEMKEKRLTPEQATARVEKLRYIWRGDDLEFAVLRKLGELAIESGDIQKGLRTLRDLIALKPDSREVTAVTQQMSQAFQKFFLSGGADKLSPIQAIGMFNEFRSLIPSGPAGNAMIRNLADRLIKVDLLDQAASLLQDQIKNRLNGADKAETGARLAFTQLLNGKPKDALAALQDTEMPGLPEEIVKDRNRLAARALADLDQVPEALARIANDQTPEGDRLRAEIDWTAGNWRAAAAALGRLVGDPPSGDAPMPDDQARRVLRYAAAQALAGDQAGLDATRGKFGPAMNKGSYKDIFAVLASDKAGPLPDVRDIQARLSSTAPFDTFLSEYRQRFGGTAG